MERDWYSFNAAHWSFFRRRWIVAMSIAELEAKIRAFLDNEVTGAASLDFDRGVWRSFNVEDGHPTTTPDAAFSTKIDQGRCDYHSCGQTVLKVHRTPLTRNKGDVMATGYWGAFRRIGLLIVLPLRFLLECCLSAERAYNIGLQCEADSEYEPALRQFTVAERKFRRKGPGGDGVLAAQMGQVRCRIHFKEYAAAHELVQDVLAKLGSRTAVRTIARGTIEQYLAIAAKGGSAPDATASDRSE